MYSLKDKFDEVCLRLGQGRRLESMGSDPIYYLVFPVSDIIEVKRQTRAWVAKLENQGWHVVVFSMANAVNAVLRDHKLRKQWLVGEKMVLDQAERTGKPVEFGEINKTLAKALTEGPELLDVAQIQNGRSVFKSGRLTTDHRSGSAPPVPSDQQYRSPASEARFAARFWFCILENAREDQSAIS